MLPISSHPSLYAPPQLTFSVHNLRIATTSLVKSAFVLPNNLPTAWTSGISWTFVTIPGSAGGAESRVRLDVDADESE